VSDFRPSGRGFDSLAPQGEGWRCSVAGKLTVDQATHWARITNTVVSTPWAQHSTTMRERHAPHLHSGRAWQYTLIFMS